MSEYTVEIIEARMSGKQMKQNMSYLGMEPIVQREEIVRCKDCKRFSLDNSDHDYRSGWWCHRWNTDMVKPDGFCAWACRKEQ